MERLKNWIKYLGKIFMAFLHKVGIIIPTTLILIALKVTGVVTWSWWLVFSPVLLYLAFIVWVFVSVFINAFVRGVIQDARSIEDEEKK